MQRAQSYPYSYQPPAATPRYSSNHSTSSAFSASANPNEDWTKISDLAERRRIQNRIAQRNYRKKLKRRLEDLERRAGSSSASPEQSHQELPGSSRPAQSPPSKTAARSVQGGRARRQPTPEKTQQHQQHASQPQPPRDMSDERSSSSMFGQQVTRQLSATPPPPPVFSYSAYPYSSDTYYSGQYTTSNAYTPLPAPYSDISQPNYLPPLPTALPMMLPASGSMKRESMYAEEDIIGPFSMSYALMAGIDIPTTQAYHDSNAHTPPLIHSSFDHSRGSSPSDSLGAYPVTPGSIPASPHLSLV